MEVPELNVDDLTAAELEVLKLIASQEGIPFEQAIDAYGWHGLFIRGR